jgi:hypothetical protein
VPTVVPGHLLIEHRLRLVDVKRYFGHGYLPLPLRPCGALS